MELAGRLAGCLSLTNNVSLLPKQQQKTSKVTKRLVNGIMAAAKESGHAITGGHISGMFGFFFCDGPVTCYEDVDGKADTAKFAKFHRWGRAAGAVG